MGGTVPDHGAVQDSVLREEITKRTADLVLPALEPLFVPQATLRGSAL